ncbi:MarR family transcriptional regulator [Pyxidicoccus trucidator]|uniref:MarR family transcriptional regulator n=1 Tax=Pyxidicoccus trucidator TaxID=2709662 RepID=UPI0013DBF4CE|nr:MarR family transcriptional regulator [Pyxidicoccus trucidator]
MKLDKVARKLSSGQLTEEALRMFARDVGHELPHHRLETLKGFRELLARAAIGPSFAWGSGYRAALLDMVASFESAVCARQDRQSAELLLRHRSAWREVLHALRDGPLTQKELAAALGNMDKGQMSRTLSEMRDAALVEVFACAEGDRSRPHQLTPLGKRLLEQHDSSELSERDEALLRFAVTFIGLSVMEGRALTGELDAVCRRAVRPEAARVVPRKAAHFLETEVQRLGVYSRGGDAVPAVAPRASIFLEGLFNRWSSHEEAPPPFWQDILRRLPGPQTPLLVRAARPGHWQRLLVQKPWGAQVPAESRVFSGVDLQHGLFDPPERGFVLVYESLALRTLDLSQGGLLRELERRAVARFCFVMKGEEVDEGYTPLEVESYFERRP